MKMAINKAHIAIGLFMIIYAVSVLFFPTNPAGNGFSSYDAGPTGTKAFYLLLSELGFHVQRTEENLKPATGLAQELLIITDQSALTGQDAVGEGLTNWVKAGGNLLLFVTGESGITDAFGITVNQKDFRGMAKVRPAALTKGVQQLNFQAGRYLSVDDPKPEIIAEGDSGPLSLLFHYGQGRVIVVADPSLITNAQIEKFDHVIFFLNVMRVIQPQTVWFDETGGAIAGRVKNDFQINSLMTMTAIQFALVILLLFVYWGKRFGRPLPLTDRDKGVSARYINTMANIFRQARARDIALDNIYSAFWHRLTKALGVPGSIATAEIINLCQNRPNLDTQGLQQIIDSVANYRQHGKATEAELFALVHDMEIWRRENLKNA